MGWHWAIVYGHFIEVDLRELRILVKAGEKSKQAVQATPNTSTALSSMGCELARRLVTDNTRRMDILVFMDLDMLIDDSVEACYSRNEVVLNETGGIGIAVRTEYLETDYIWAKESNCWMVARLVSDDKCNNQSR